MLYYYMIDLKYQHGKKMFASNALFRLHIEANQDAFKFLTTT